MEEILTGFYSKWSKNVEDIKFLILHNTKRTFLRTTKMMPEKWRGFHTKRKKKDSVFKDEVRREFLWKVFLFLVIHYPVEEKIKTWENTLNHDKEKLTRWNIKFPLRRLTGAFSWQWTRTKGMKWIEKHLKNLI